MKALTAFRPWIDHLDSEGDTWAANFAFTQDVGRAFLKTFPEIVRRRMATPFTEADKAQQLEWRGRYAEFNLVYDRSPSRPALPLS